MRRAAVSIALAVLVFLNHGVRVSAWGAVGHHVVARIAWARLTPATRAAVESILGAGITPFVSASTWADDVRSMRPETANWHFVDIPADADRYDAARDCRPTERGDCVVAELIRLQTALAQHSQETTSREETLKFLIHFVGDIHQPLHAIDDHDRGGNDVRVNSLRDGATGRATNLHAAWDTGIINLSAETEAARAARLLAGLSARHITDAFEPARWADDTHAVALRHAYHYPSFSPSGPPSTPITLDRAYLTQAEETIDDQLAIGGVRLAAVLNATLGRASVTR